MAQAQFYQILSAAVADLIEHGFDSQSRLDMWVERLRAAAPSALQPEDVLIRLLKSNLEQTYIGALKGPRLLRKHPAVSEFTIQQIKPKLRAELDRRIMGSVQLIRLNRSASIDRALQRFAGWATSIPIGGSDVASRQETKAHIRRGIAALPFEERRVIIDQGHKLAATIDDIIARDGGAIALIWHHVPEHRPAYDARPVHVARDKKIYLLRESWAMRDGLIRRGAAPYYDEVTAVGEEIFCRCSAEYIYALRDLPENLLSNKGRIALIEARRKLA